MQHAFSPLWPSSSCSLCLECLCFHLSLLWSLSWSIPSLLPASLSNEFTQHMSTECLLHERLGWVFMIQQEWRQTWSLLVQRCDSPSLEPYLTLLTLPYSQVCLLIASFYSYCSYSYCNLKTIVKLNSTNISHVSFTQRLHFSCCPSNRIQYKTMFHP